jgi:hypothetical protein
LDGEPLMGIFRRARRPTPPLRHRQQQIERQESELREKLQRLERMVTRDHSGVHNKSPRPGAEAPVRSSKTEQHLNVSLALEGENHIAPSRTPRKLRSLRKQRREGRIIFLFLLTALAVAVMWLISHLHT